MTFLTIFTTPKPFIDSHICTIQRNAIKNWTQFGDDVKVVMIGDEVGMPEVAAENNVLHLPRVKCNEKGTPLISSLFKIGREVYNSPVLLYLNADILIYSDMIQAARRVAEQQKNFLIVGQRWDLDVTEAIDYSEGWEERLRLKMKVEGILHKPTGSDYFLYSKSVLRDIPDFAVGRAGWDNWMIYHGVKSPWHVIDGSFEIDIVHQNHDYRHLQDGKKHYGNKESKENTKKGGGTRSMYMVLDTNRELRDGKVQWPKFSGIRFVRRVERLLQPNTDIDGSIRWRLTRKLRQWRKRNLSRG